MVIGVLRGGDVNAALFEFPTYWNLCIRAELVQRCGNPKNCMVVLDSQMYDNSLTCRTKMSNPESAWRFTALSGVRTCLNAT